MVRFARGSGCLLFATHPPRHPPFAHSLHSSTSSPNHSLILQALSAPCVLFTSQQPSSLCLHSCHIALEQLSALQQLASRPHLCCATARPPSAYPLRPPEHHIHSPHQLPDNNCLLAFRPVPTSSSPFRSRKLYPPPCYLRLVQFPSSAQSSHTASSPHTYTHTTHPRQ